jgi:alpha-glucosidase
MMVAENWTNNRSSLESYMVKDDKKAFHMTLDFPTAYALNDRNLTLLSSHYSWALDNLDPAGSMGSFLSNHDNVVIRPASTHGENLLKAVIAAQILGVDTPFIYYGNEIGQSDAQEYAGQSHEDRRHRQPLEWSMVTNQETDPDSILNLTRTLVALRNQRQSLRRGDWQVISTAGNVLVVKRQSSQDLGDTPQNQSTQEPQTTADPQEPKDLPEATLLVINFASSDRRISLDSSILGVPMDQITELLTESTLVTRDSTLTLELSSGGVVVVGL